MSMRSWSQNGYGFAGDILDKFSLESKVAFTKEHLPDIYKDVSESIEDIEDWEHFFDYECMEEFNSDSSGFGNIIAEVLRREENLCVDYCTGENNYGFLMVCETLPWLMSEEMKNLTQDKFIELVNGYVSELKELDKHTPDINIDFEYESVEYYG